MLRKIGRPGKPVRIIELDKVFPSQEAAAKFLGGHQSGISNQIHGRIKSYFGYHYEFVDEL